MSKSVVLHLTQILRRESKRWIAAMRKVTSAHITMGLVAGALIATVYAVETKAMSSSDSSQKSFEIFRQPQSK